MRLEGPEVLPLAVRGIGVDVLLADIAGEGGSGGIALGIGGGRWWIGDYEGCLRDVMSHASRVVEKRALQA